MIFIGIFGIFAFGFTEPHFREKRYIALFNWNSRKKIPQKRNGLAYFLANIRYFGNLILLVWYFSTFKLLYCFLSKELGAGTETERTLHIVWK